MNWVVPHKQISFVQDLLDGYTMKLSRLAATYRGISQIKEVVHGVVWCSLLLSGAAAYAENNAESDIHIIESVLGDDGMTLKLKKGCDSDPDRLSGIETKN